MAIEIKDGDGTLGATRYGGTQTFARTRAHALEAIRYGGTQTFTRTRAHALEAYDPGIPLAKKSTELQEERILGSAGVPVRYGTVGVGMVPGVLLTLYVFTQSNILTSQVLDASFRNMFAQLGYDVSASLVSIQKIGFKWQSVQGEWEAVLVSGPPQIQGAKGFLTTDSAPTAQVTAKLPTQVEIYQLVARPKDLTVTPEDLKTLSVALLQTSARVEDNAGRRTTTAFDISLPMLFPFVAVQGVEPPKPAEPESNAGIWLGLLSVGWAALLAMKGKTT